MSAFRLWAFLLPLLVGFGVPALLAWRPGARGWSAVAAYLGALLSVALVLRLFRPEPAWTLLSVTVFTLAFAVFVCGVLLAFPRPIVGQIAAGLVVTAMMGTIFYFPKTFEPGLGLPAIQQRIELALTLNPYAVMSLSIFEGIDLLRGALYSDWADYQIVHPRWGLVAAGYVLAGALLAALGRLVARLRRAPPA